MTPHQKRGRIANPDCQTKHSTRHCHQSKVFWSFELENKQSVVTAADIYHWRIIKEINKAFSHFFFNAIRNVGWYAGEEKADAILRFLYYSAECFVDISSEIPTTAAAVFEQSKKQPQMIIKKGKKKKSKSTDQQRLLSLSITMRPICISCIWRFDLLHV